MSGIELSEKETTACKYINFLLMQNSIKSFWDIKNVGCGLLCGMHIYYKGRILLRSSYFDKSNQETHGDNYYYFFYYY